MSEEENKKIAPVLYPWQTKVWDELNQKINNERLPHALLLQGAPDSGLDSFASLFSQYLLCSNKKQSGACGQCRDCLLFIAGSHPGFMEILPLESDEGKISKVIKIDQIRDSVDFVMQTSMQNGMKVLLIRPADTMNPNAANALLKNLEEPPRNTQFLLVTNNPGRLMPTIRSRCQVIDIALPTLADAEQWLTPFIQDGAKRKQLLELSAGNPLLVKQWQDTAAIADIFALREQVFEVLAKRNSPLALAKSWLGHGAERIAWWWRWLLLEAKQGAVNHNTVLDTRQLAVFMEKLLVAKRQLESSANPNEQLLLESLLVDWQNQI